MEVIKSRRGNEHIIFDGYRYRINRVCINSINWRCVDKKCKATGFTSQAYKNDGCFTTKVEHNHVPDPAKCKTEKLISAIKLKACSDQALQPQSIVSDLVSDLNNECRDIMPELHNIRRVIKRERNKITSFPVHPKDLVRLINPKSFKLTSVGKIFLLFDSGENCPVSNRIIIFASNQMLQMLGQNRNWQIDGTNKISTLFFQVFWISIIVNERTIPCVFALLPDILESTFTQMFKTLLNHSPYTLEPKSCKLYVNDFKMETLNAFKHSFPDTQLLFSFGTSCYEVLKCNMK